MQNIKTLEGTLNNVGGRYGIVVARFNSFVVEALLEGAVDALVRHGVSAGVQNATGVPVVFGVLTVDTIEQAIERSGTKAGNKGAEAAMSALEMVSLFKAL